MFGAFLGRCRSFEVNFRGKDSTQRVSTQRYQFSHEHQWNEISKPSWHPLN